MWFTVLVVFVVVLLLLTNAVGVLLVALQLPGTWLMVVATSLFAWWRWGAETMSYGWGTLAALLALAVLGEIVEFVAGAMGSTVAGGTKRGAAISVVTAIAGAILGSFLIPIPIAGTLLGAGIGAGLGALAGDKWAGKPWNEAWKVAGGAAVGKFSGAVGKLAIAAAMWLVTAVMLFV